MIVGGGAVARRRAAALVEAGAVITVIAPDVDAELTAMGLAIQRRPYREGDLEGAVLAVVATDDMVVNERVARDGRAAGVLLNRTDDPRESDVLVPAHAHHGPVTIAVHTGGVSAGAAAAIRRQLSAALDTDWPRLLLVVAPFRTQILQCIDDPATRRARLMALTDETAMKTLKDGGEQTLRQYCQRLCEDTSIG